MKRSWFSRHPLCFMALYLILYLSAFNFLNTQIHMPHILVHCRLDDLIPFCKYAVIPYFAWFPWIPFTLFFLLWKAPREDFWRLCMPLFSGMTIALACYVILPTGLNLRPCYVPGTDIFARAVRFLYSTDTPINVHLHWMLHHAAQAAQLHRCSAGRFAGAGTGYRVQPYDGHQRSAADAPHLNLYKKEMRCHRGTAHLFLFRTDPPAGRHPALAPLPRKSP